MKCFYNRTRNEVHKANGVNTVWFEFTDCVGAQCPFYEQRQVRENGYPTNKSFCRKAEAELKQNR